MSAANLRLINWIRGSPWPFRNESLFQKGYRHNYDSTQPVFVSQVVKDTVVNMKRNGNDHSRQKLLDFTSRKGKAINGKFCLDIEVLCLNESQTDILDLYDVFLKSVHDLIPHAFILALFPVDIFCINAAVGKCGLDQGLCQRTKFCFTKRCGFGLDQTVIHDLIHLQHKISFCVEPDFWNQLQEDEAAKK